MKVITPYETSFKYDDELYYIYLSGDSNKEWREYFIHNLVEVEDVVIFNYANSFKYSIEWERERMLESDLIFFNFMSSTNHASVFLALGEMANKSNAIVCCIETSDVYFFVKAYCDAHDITLVHEQQLAFDIIKNTIP